MCCFTGNVESVSSTKIFCRPAREGRQFVVYHMLYQAKEELAMVLPIPTPPKSADDAVKFISLEEYDQFFQRLEDGFPRPRPKTAALPPEPSATPLPKPLPVVEVGSFEASFVPSVADFSRLDKRFRLPDGVWAKLPAYKDFGFAVFKLKAGKPKIHPMAFEFPRARPERIFFPTVHIHDGLVHAEADFDHVLYLQPGSAESRTPRDWEESPQPAGMFMDVKKSQGLVAGDLHVYRKRLAGKLKNADTLV
jgi:hypothetical protein